MARVESWAPCGGVWCSVRAEGLRAEGASSPSSLQPCRPHPDSPQHDQPCHRSPASPRGSAPGAGRGAVAWVGIGSLLARGSSWAGNYCGEEADTRPDTGGWNAGVGWGVDPQPRETERRVRGQATGTGTVCIWSEVAPQRSRQPGARLLTWARQGRRPPGVWLGCGSTLSGG